MQAGDDFRNEKLAIIAAWAPAGAASKTRTRRRDSHGRDGPQDQRRRYQPALQLGPGVAGARHHGGRLRGTGRLPPAAPLSAEPRQASAGEVRARRAARLRRQQHPLHHLDQDRRVGARQALPVGVDIIEPPMMFELEKASLKIKDGQQVMLEARELKNIDEIALLNRSAAMVDGAYHLINEELKPGV